MLGLPFFARGVADTMSEVAIQYPHSPLNGPSLRGGLRPGERVPPSFGQTPVGAGGRPTFTLFADDGAAAAELAREFSGLVEAEVRPALETNDFSLVRPDGYLACSSPDASGVAAYLRQLP